MSEGNELMSGASKDEMITVLSEAERPRSYHRLAKKKERNYAKNSQ